MEEKYLKRNKTLPIVKEIIIIRVYAKTGLEFRRGECYVKVIGIGNEVGKGFQMVCENFGKSSNGGPGFEGKVD